MLQFRPLRMVFVPWMVFVFAVASTGVYSLVTVPSAEASSHFSIKAGGYYGNGASLSISGLGFTPAAVIIKSDAALSSIWQSSAGSATTGTHFGIVTADNTASGVALSADGFTVSQAPTVNTVNTHYTYFALAGSGCSPGDAMCVGLYTGDGTASRAIFVGDSGTSTPSDVAGSFTVGSTNNTNGNVYHYVAFANVAQAPAPGPASCVLCAAPPANCSYIGGSCQSCGTLSCPTPTPEPPSSDGGGDGAPTGDAPGAPGAGAPAGGAAGPIGEEGSGAAPGAPGAGAPAGDTGETGPAPSSDSSSGFSIGDAVGFGISNSVTGAVASAFGIGTAPSNPAAVGLSAVGLGISLGFGPIGMAVAIGLAIADAVTNGQVSNSVDAVTGGLFSAIGNAVMGIANAIGGLFGFGNPGNVGGVPGDPGDPGQGGVAPGDVGTGEGDTGGVPGDPGDPGQGGVAPGDVGTGEGDTGGVPGDPGDPGQGGVAPGDVGTGEGDTGDPGDAAPGDAAPGDSAPGDAGPGGGGPGGGDAGGAGDGGGDGGK